MGIRVLLGFLLAALPFLGVAADGSMPWAFGNGSAKGYSQAGIGFAGAWDAYHRGAND